MTKGRIQNKNQSGSPPLILTSDFWILDSEKRKAIAIKLSPSFFLTLRGLK
jgi:hypothetical protein